jgi:hypothetical protein
MDLLVLSPPVGLKGGPTGPLSQLPDRGSPPTGVAGPHRAAPYKGGGGHEEQNPVSPTRPTSLPTDQGEL